MRNNICWILILLGLSMVLGGCGVEEDVKHQIHSSIVDEYSSGDVAAETEIKDCEDEIAVESSGHADNTEWNINLVSDAKMSGAGDDLISYLEIYESQLEDKMAPIAEAQLSRWSMIRYAVLDINNDKLPELMLCFGDSHVEHIYVWSISEDCEMCYWGAYGSFGSMYIDIDNGMMISSYGSQGYYYWVFSNEHGIEKIGLDNGRGEYFRVEVSDDWNGSMAELVHGEYVEKDALTAIDDYDVYSIPEDEFNIQFNISDKYISLNYRDMRWLYSE